MVAFGMHSMFLLVLLLGTRGEQISMSHLEDSVHSHEELMSSKVDALLIKITGLSKVLEKIAAKPKGSPTWPKEGSPLIPASAKEKLKISAPEKARLRKRPLVRTSSFKLSPDGVASGSNLFHPHMLLPAAPLIKPASSGTKLKLAIGINTGSGVQDKRVPAVLSWLKCNKHSTILSDKADERLGITAIPPPYFCTTSGKPAHNIFVDLPSTFGQKATHAVNDYWAGWWRWEGGWTAVTPWSPMKKSKDGPAFPDQVTLASVATNSKRCIDYRFLYIVPLLLNRYPNDDFYFRADDDVYVDLATVQRALSVLDPAEAAIVGFEGDSIKGNRNPFNFKHEWWRCDPLKGVGEFQYFGGLFAFSRAAAQLFARTIASTVSEYEFLKVPYLLSIPPLHTSSPYHFSSPYLLA
jgi:hypothetical protein